jgi:hypothetical protein
MSVFSEVFAGGLAGGLLNVDAEIKRRRDSAAKEEQELRLMERRAQLEQRMRALDPQFFNTPLGPVAITGKMDDQENLSHDISLLFNDDQQRRLQEIENRPSPTEAIAGELAQARLDAMKRAAQEAEDKPVEEAKKHLRETVTSIENAYLTEVLKEMDEADQLEFNKDANGDDAESRKQFLQIVGGGEDWEAASKFVKGFNISKARLALRKHTNKVISSIGADGPSMDQEVMFNSMEKAVRAAKDEVLGIDFIRANEEVIADVVASLTKTSTDPEQTAKDFLDLLTGDVKKNKLTQDELNILIKEIEKRSGFKFKR